MGKNKEKRHKEESTPSQLPESYFEKSTSKMRRDMQEYWERNHPGEDYAKHQVENLKRQQAEEAKNQQEIENVLKERPLIPETIAKRVAEEGISLVFQDVFSKLQTHWENGVKFEEREAETSERMALSEVTAHALGGTVEERRLGIKGILYLTMLEGEKSLTSYHLRQFNELPR